MRPRTWLLSIGCLTMIALASATRVAQAAPDDEETPRHVHLYPMAEAKPALRYELMPPALQRTQGNAAVHYGKVDAEEMNYFSNSELQDKVSEWASETPLTELRDPKIVPPGEGEIVSRIRRGARCANCDWEVPLHDGNLYLVTLGEFQRMRSFARIILARARIHIARGEFEPALLELQTSLAMGRHTSQADFIVCELIGIAIANMTAEATQELIQRPDTPNLYWALTRLPRPIVDMRRGIDTELHGVELQFPELQHVETASYSREQWDALLEKVWTTLDDLMSGLSTQHKSSRLSHVARVMRGYPMAKQALIERGRLPKEVDAMPVSQVVLIYTKLTYDELASDVFKWYFVDYPSGVKGSLAAEETLRRAEREEREILPVAQSLLPAVTAVRNAECRHIRKIELLRLFEALRIHAADHDGQLPKRLEDITQVPTPMDPLTGRSFGYELKDGKARVFSPPLPGESFEYEITMERP